MNPALPEEAADFGAAAEKAFAALGGVGIARNAEADPRVRQDVAAALRSLGAEDLDPRDDLSTAAAASELCRVAGRVALPYPVASALVRDPDGSPTAVVGAITSPTIVDHGDLFDEWLLVTIDGLACKAAPTGERLGSKLGPFVCEVGRETHERQSRGGDAALWLSLGAWRVLGCVQRALELAVEHVRGRDQFGQKLSQFQAVRFQLADAAVAVAGLEELCLYTTWRLWSAPDDAVTDALALRLFALDTARTVLRTSQQLHGASGVCDEYDVSVLARLVQPDLRLPFGSTSTTALLAGAIARGGFASLFPQGGAAD